MFANRRDAGAQLARRLTAWAPRSPVVVGLPRGGVPVAAEVAAALQSPLDIVVVRKIGCPWQPELGVGAIAEGDVAVLNDALVAELRISSEDLQAVIEKERTELERRVRRYRGSRAPVPLAGRAVIVVDDGLATGYTARAAIRAVRGRGAAEVVLAVPVAPPQSARDLEGEADQFVAVDTPPWFYAIGQFYEDFSPTSDEEVVALLEPVVPPSQTTGVAGPAGDGR
jgi:putative phosphoribosyl transferase